MKTAPCIIVNMSGGLMPDRFGDERVIPKGRTPSYVHDDLEAARKEALRLHSTHAGKNGSFVIFQAVEATEWRDFFTIAADPVAVIHAMECEPAVIPEKPRKRKAHKGGRA